MELEHCMEDSLKHAHSTASTDRSDWETTVEHATRVSMAAGDKASAFGATTWGRVLGALHDLGKETPEFQRRLQGGPPVSHAGQGAVEAMQLFGRWSGRLLGYCIAGHHAGLPDDIERGSGGQTLEDWEETTRRLPDLPNWMRPLLAPLEPSPPPLSGRKGDAFARALFTRMIYSALIDADRQETARFYGELATTQWSEPEEKWREETFERFEASHERFMASLASRPQADAEVARLRTAVLTRARERATELPGLFSMTVPTGGGKTLASLAFAIRHARIHRLRRIVYVAPFTAIVEQTAAVFRSALEDADAVLEHHSNFEPGGSGSIADDDERRTLREAELRWEHPVIVTTAVQLFESLFASSPARCRKLHRLARSIIVLDEFQALPLHVLRPCLRALTELATGYGASVILCTATQPAVRAEDGFDPVEDALSDVREIAPDPQEMAIRLARVTVEQAGVVSDDRLTEAFEKSDQMLAIVNNRRHAREQYALIAGLDGARHLSTAMMPTHRKRVLEGIREDLSTGYPCRLVSTSLVEAGVDIDFPEVWRALAGIEGMTQAAGRCNREGRLGPRGGRFVIFEPQAIEGRAPPRVLARFADAARIVMAEHPDPLTLAALRRYFEEIYWQKGAAGLDTLEIGRDMPVRGVLRAIGEGGSGDKPDLPFAAIAHAFRLIDEGGLPIVIPESVHRDGAPEQLVRQLRFATSIGSLARDLQRHAVSVPERARAELIAVGAAQMVRKDMFGSRFVVLSECGPYSEATGLDWSDPTYREAEGLIF